MRRLWPFQSSIKDQQPPMLITAIRRCTTVLLLAVVPAVSALEIVKPVPSPPQLAAKAYVLMEYNSGRVLVDHNADKAFEPASLTKIMTDYIVSDELAKGSMSLDEEVTISEKAWKMGGSKMFIEVGKKVSIKDLIHGMVIQSGNDASVQLAETVAGSEETFAELMNQYAKHLGMRNTHFKNATGMPAEGHLSSAQDMAVLARSFIRDFPEDYKIYSIKSFEYNDIKQKNRNGLLWSDDTVDGMKTGHTDSAGYGLVASSVRDGMRLIAVVMGTDSANARLSATAKLLSYGFRFFSTRELYAAGSAIDNLRVWGGAEKTVPVGLLEPLSVAFPRGQDDKLTTRLELHRGVQAPLKQGAEVGRLRVVAGEDIIADEPVVALREVPAGGIVPSVRDAILQYFE